MVILYFFFQRSVFCLFVCLFCLSACFYLFVVCFLSLLSFGLFLDRFQIDSDGIVRTTTTTSALPENRIFNFKVKAKETGNYAILEQVECTIPLIFMLLVRIYSFGII